MGNGGCAPVCVVLTEQTRKIEQERRLYDFLRQGSFRWSSKDADSLKWIWDQANVSTISELVLCDGYFADLGCVLDHRPPTEIMSVHFTAEHTGPLVWRDVVTWLGRMKTRRLLMDSPNHIITIDDMISLLSSADSLRELVLREITFSHRPRFSPSYHSDIVELVVSATSYTDWGVHFFTTLFDMFPNVTRLCVGAYRVQNQLLEALLAAPFLSKLRVITFDLYSPCSREDARAIKLVLEKLVAIDTLSFNVRCPIELSVLLELIEAAAKLSTLCDLNVVTSDVCDISVLPRRYFSSNAKLTSFQLHGSASVESVAYMEPLLESVLGVTGLTELSVDYIKKVPRDRLSSYSCVENLTNLIYQQSTKVDDGIFDLLTECRRLTNVQLQVDFSSLTEIGPISSCISSLRLIPTTRVDNVFVLLRALRHPERLHTLAMAGLEATHERSENLAMELRRFPFIETLTFEFSYPPTEENEPMSDFFAPLEHVSSVGVFVTCSRFYNPAHLFNALARHPLLRGFSYNFKTNEPWTAEAALALTAMCKSTQVCEMNLYDVIRATYVQLAPHMLRNCHNMHQRTLSLTRRLLNCLDEKPQCVRRLF